MQYIFDGKCEGVQRTFYSRMGGTNILWRRPCTHPSTFQDAHVGSSLPYSWQKATFGLYAKLVFNFRSANLTKYIWMPQLWRTESIQAPQFFIELLGQTNITFSSNDAGEWVMYRICNLKFTQLTSHTSHAPCWYEHSGTVIVRFGWLISLSLDIL